MRRAIGAARATGVPVTARGTGTSLAGEATSPGLVLDTSAMDRLLELDAGAARARVEPGLIQAHLNAHAAPHGLVFGADTSTSAVATLGGMIGNDSAGMRSIVYGRTRDQVLGLRCVLSDGATVDLAPMPRAEAIRRAQGGDRLAGLLRTGLELADRYGDEVRRRYPDILRRVSGYGLDALLDPDTLDLARLVCGSEGTLAVTTRADVRLHPLPPSAGWRRCSSRRSPRRPARRRSSCASARAPWSCSTTSPSTTPARTASGATAPRSSHGDAAALLLVEWSGTAEEVAERLAAADAIGRDVGAGHVALLPDAADQAQTVRLRASILPLLLGRSDTTEARRVRRGRRRGSGAARGVRRALRGAAGGRAGRGPASTGTRRSAACTSVPRWTRASRATSPGCAASPSASPTSSSSSAGRCRASTATGCRARSSSSGCTGRARRRVRRAQGGVGPGRPAEPRRHRPPRPHGHRPARQPRPPRRRGADEARLRPPGIVHQRDRAVQRHRAVPQDRHRLDVPVVHGHARRARHDARPRERPALRPRRLAADVRADRRGDARGHGPLRRLQGVRRASARPASTSRP